VTQSYLYIYRYDTEVYKIGISKKPLDRIKSYIKESSEFDIKDKKNLIFHSSDKNIKHVEKQVKNIFSDAIYRSKDSKYENRDGKTELFYVKHIDTIIRFIKLTYENDLELTELSQQYEYSREEIKKELRKLSFYRGEILKNIFAYHEMSELLSKVFNNELDDITIEQTHKEYYTIGLPITENGYIEEIFTSNRKTSICWNGVYNNMVSCYYVENGRTHIGFIFREEIYYEDVIYKKLHGKYLERWNYFVSMVKTVCDYRSNQEKNKKHLVFP
jgi:hypothetical protein